MTQQQATHTHIFADKANPGRYWAKAWHPTEGTTHYHLSVGEHGEMRCTCLGWTYRYDCRHAQALARRIQREARRLAREARHRQPAQLRPETERSITLLYPTAA